MITPRTIIYLKYGQKRQIVAAQIQQVRDLRRLRDHHGIAVQRAQCLPQRGQFAAVILAGVGQRMHGDRIVVGCRSVRPDIVDEIAIDLEQPNEFELVQLVVPFVPQVMWHGVRIGANAGVRSEFRLYCGGF